MVSPNLLAERENLLAQIESVQSLGDVAPPGVRIEPDFLNPKCWLLVNTNLPLRERKLGQSGSPQHREWTERILRRDRLHELEQQLALLQGLIDRQQQFEANGLGIATDIVAGDTVEVDGIQYKVEDVGLKYLRLVDANGKVTRREIGQARLISQVV
ncbi:MAG TPA: hypothetical protein V6C78_26980 [Crinalium sp.]|jgi:hypothetical protein